MFNVSAANVLLPVTRNIYSIGLLKTIVKDCIRVLRLTYFLLTSLNNLLFINVHLTKYPHRRKQYKMYFL